MLAYKVLEIPSRVDLDHGLPALVHNGKGEVFSVFLDVLVVKGSADESFRVKNSVLWVLGRLVLCGITDQSFFIGESDP